MVLLCTILAVLLLGQFNSCAISEKNAVTHKQRIDFISNLGYSVDEASSTQKNIIIPYEFSDVYINYNDLQIKAGYNLKEYKGKKVILYSYPIINDGQAKNINLLVYNGIIIGGDVSDLSIRGEIVPLLKNKE